MLAHQKLPKTLVLQMLALRLQTHQIRQQSHHHPH